MRFPNSLYGNLYPASFQKEELIFLCTKHRHFRKDKLCDLRDKSAKRFILRGFHHLFCPYLFKRTAVCLHLIPSFHELFPVCHQFIECLHKSLFKVGIVNIGISACYPSIRPVVLALPLYDSSLEAAAADFGRYLSVIGGGRMYVDAKVNSPAGKYMVSLRVSNEGYSVVLPDIFTFILQ